MYTLVLFLPLISAITSGLLGRYIGYNGAGRISSTLIVITFFISTIIFYEVGLNHSFTYIYLFKWIDSGLLDISFGLQFDSITAVMLIVVTSVSALVHIYSTEYMAGDPHLQRFMSYLSLFTFFMLILVTADNYIQLFIGWEGVGLCSYLLINFWYTRIQANKSAIKAMIVNRVGDLGLALGMFTIFYQFKAIDYATVFSMVSYVEKEVIIFGDYQINLITLIGILLLIGAVGKSAQLGLHTWLPDAMEGPTPVSALIHAATMVTAGVFLLIRSSPILEWSETALGVITIFGALTAFFAATVGLVQNDIKRVIAYSTCSQLGYMVFACGISNYQASLFHLMNHAFFKALLFLSAGAVIHAVADEQDMRKMGGLIKSLPLTYSMMLIGSLSLMGFPFLTGFYSKDAILELAYGAYTVEGTFAHWLGTISALMTATYSLRLLLLTFISNPNGPQDSLKNSHESPAAMTIPLIILAIGSIVVGYLFKDLIIGIGTSFFDQSIVVLPKHISLINAEHMPIFVKWLPVILSILGALTAGIIYTSHSLQLSLVQFKLNNSKLYTFLSNKWHFDYIYNFYIVKNLYLIGHDVTYKIIDKGLINPKLLIGNIRKASEVISKLQSGLVYNYALTIFVFTTLYLTLITVTNISTEWLLIFPVIIYILT